MGGYDASVEVGLKMRNIVLSLRAYVCTQPFYSRSKDGESLQTIPLRP